MSEPGLLGVVLLGALHLSYCLTDHYWPLNLNSDGDNLTGPENGYCHN